MKYRLTFVWLLFALILASCGAAAPTSPAVAPAATMAPVTAAPTSAPTEAPTAPVTPTLAPTATQVVRATIAPSMPGSPGTVLDAAGRDVRIGDPAKRIVSLAPSTTEIAFALGAGSTVVGVDAFSDYPAEVKQIAKVGNPDGSYNLEQIVALKPDLILAAGGITPIETVKQLAELGLKVAVIGSPETTMDSIFSDIELVGKLTGKQTESLNMTDDMRKRIDAVKASAAKATTKPKVYWELDATDPTKPYTVGPGNFINNIIELAGGENIFASASSPFAQVSTEQIVAANPDVIILSDAAYGITPESVEQRTGWANIAAVKNKRVMPIDDNIVSRPGPRVVDGLETALYLIHPELGR